jgi:citrate lyase subunit beta/citryl-CoA lyase
MSIRPRRSVLFMPGTNARAIEKARTLPADCIVLDLEDSVAPDSKAAARTQVAEAVTAGGFGPREVIIRVNGLESDWWVEDVSAAVVARPDAILFPKVSSVDHVHRIAARLFDMGADHTIQVWAMMETARAIVDARAIAAASQESRSRLTVFVMGTNDIAKETRARMLPGRAPMVSWLSTCVAAARAYGLDIIDGVYNDIKDADGFVRECEQGRDLGFDGKSVIHPGQIAPGNNVFAPAADEVAQARAILAAFARPENADKGVIALDGRMVERLHAEMAQRTVAIAEAIAARS